MPFRGLMDVTVRDNTLPCAIGTPPERHIGRSLRALDDGPPGKETGGEVFVPQALIFIVFRKIFPGYYAAS